MRIGRIRACDVLEDRNNPRDDFGDLQELAESFSLNEDRPGEPFIPPIVVQDGSKYRIVDGARRFRAMQLIGIEDFTANVCDPITDQDAILAMLATDDKKALTDEERCRGVQQALVLGVDPHKVERASRIKGAAKVKRGMQRAGELAEEMTLEHLIAVEEAETDEQARNIACLPEGKWQREVQRIEHAKQAAEKGEELRNWCRANSVPLSDDCRSKCHKMTVNTPKLLSDFIETNGRLEGLAVMVREEPSNGSAWASVYADMPDSMFPDNQENELREKVDKRLVMLNQCTDAVLRFALEKYGETGDVPKFTMGAITDYYISEKKNAYFDNKLAELGLDIGLKDYRGLITGAAAAVTLVGNIPKLSYQEIKDCFDGAAGASTARKAGFVLDLLLSAKTDGCEMPTGWGFLREDLAKWERDYAKEGEDA